MRICKHTHTNTAFCVYIYMHTVYKNMFCIMCCSCGCWVLPATPLGQLRKVCGNWANPKALWCRRLMVTRPRKSWKIRTRKQRLRVRKKQRLRVMIATKEKTQAGTRRDCDSLDVALKKDGALHARTQIDIVFMGYQNWCLDPGLDCQGDEKDSDEEKSSKGKANLAAERVSEALVNLLFTRAHTHTVHT